MSAAARATAGQPAGGADCWALSIASIDRWLKHSQTGDALVYAHGAAIPDPGVADYMNRLAHNKEVRLHPRRTADGGLDRVAIRDRVHVTVPLRPRPAASAVLDAATSAVLLKLNAVAKAGERCPSDKALAAAIGLERNQVTRCVRNLKQLEIIRSEVVAVPGDPKFRIITILASKISTAGPK